MKTIATLVGLGLALSVAVDNTPRHVPVMEAICRASSDAPLILNAEWAIVINSTPTPIDIGGRCRALG